MVWYVNLIVPVIPYINVPASGDFQQMKAQLQQVQRITQINLNKNHTETLLDIGWGQLGLEAYRACLNTQKGEALIIEHLKGSDPFSNELIVSLTWQRRTNSVPKPIERIICLGCDYSGAKEGDLVEQGKSYLLQLKRHAETNLSIVVTVDGLVGQFRLPKPPKPPKISDENWTILAQATQPTSAQQLILPHKVF